MLFATLVALILGAFAFLNVPGMVVVGAYKLKFMPMMGLGQAWTFSFIISGIWAAFLYIGNHRNWWVKYLVSCGVILALGLVMHFGFMAEYPVTLAKVFFTSGKEVENKKVATPDWKVEDERKAAEMRKTAQEEDDYMKAHPTPHPSKAF
jgi:hypothetical protein